MLWLRLCICVDLGIGRWHRRSRSPKQHAENVDEQLGSGRADVGRPLPMDTNNDMILHNEDI